MKRSVRHDRVLARPAAPRRCSAPQARQELAHVERLGHVVVGAGVQRAHLVVAVRAGGQHEHRAGEPRAQPGEHLRAVQVGQAEIEDDHVGVLGGGGAQRRPAVGGVDDVVAGGPQRDPERAGDLRVVVDDQHADHGAGSAGWHLRAGRRRNGGRREREHHRQATAGGVLGGQRAAHRLAEPAGHGESEADALTDGASPSRWNGAKSRSRSAGRMPGPAVGHPQLDAASPTGAAVTLTGPEGVPQGVAHQVLHTRSSRPGSASAAGRSCGPVQADAGPVARVRRVEGPVHGLGHVGRAQRWR